MAYQQTIGGDTDAGATTREQVQREPTGEGAATSGTGGGRTGPTDTLPTPGITVHSGQ